MGEVFRRVVSLFFHFIFCFGERGVFFVFSMFFFVFLTTSGPHHFWP